MAGFYCPRSKSAGCSREPGVHVRRTLSSKGQSAVMDLRLEHYLAKIRECERNAEQGRDPAIRYLYRDWLRQWRELTAIPELPSAPPADAPDSPPGTDRTRWRPWARFIRSSDSR